MSDDNDILMPEVTAALGGEREAELVLYATCYRCLIKDGPYVWEMTHDERVEARNAFFKEWGEADDQDRQHLIRIIQDVSEAMNTHHASMPAVTHFQVSMGGEEELPLWLTEALKRLIEKYGGLRRR